MAQEYEDNYYNDDDSRYSKYPTNVNKYECKKGPFEGFFVSSVEFCLSKSSPNPPAPPSPINNKLPLVNTFNCIDNNNINTNEADAIQSSGEQQRQQSQDGSVQGLNGNVEGLLGQIDLNKNIVNLCIINNNNNNNNEPEPGTSSLKVNKEIYGCNNITVPPEQQMDCETLDNNSPGWINCNPPSSISSSLLCQGLQANFFDIEVEDDQNNQIEQFEGSAEGETIENLEPGTYTVNEIIHSPTFVPDQLREDAAVQESCMNLGFAGGGKLTSSLQNSPQYQICFEYEDEQGSDCRTITLAAEEEKTCTVKNYIHEAHDD